MPATNSVPPDPGTVRPKRRRRLPIGMILLVTLAAAISISAPYWMPILRDEMDARHLASERTARYARFSTGQANPGTPDLANLDSRLSTAGFKLGAPILIRIFKREFELELWMQKDGTFQHFVTYPICRWSGKLGPKLVQGDGQSPEGFYSVGKNQLNPNSKYHRSFNLGYPNAFDRSHGRTGDFLMVHGACASVGCFAMTDAQVDEIWRLVTAALDGGQPAFQVQAFPFRMTDTNVDGYEGHADHAFWRDLKLGYDIFEKTKLPVRTSVCAGRYVFEAASQSGITDVTPTERCPNASAKN